MPIKIVPKDEPKKESSDWLKAFRPYAVTDIVNNGQSSLGLGDIVMALPYPDGSCVVLNASKGIVCPPGDLKGASFLLEKDLRQILLYQDED